MQIFFLDPGKVRSPEDGRILFLGEFLLEERKRAVPAPGIDPHDFYPLIQKPQGRFPAHAATFEQVLRLSPVTIRAGHDQDDIPGLDPVSNFLERPF